MPRIVAALAALALAACQNAAEERADNAADALDNAAAQSTPEAAAVLNQQAEAIREGETGANLSDPQGPVQQAMENASAVNTPPVVSNEQAKPHRRGDPVPPPQVEPQR